VRKLLLLVIPALFLTGCAHHYYQFSGSDLEIYLKAPGASSVLFASSLDGYEPHPALKAGRSTWVVHVPKDREFSYFYKVDGRVFVPECAYREYDDLGSESCVYIPGM
jgi:hypothetical protein